MKGNALKEQAPLLNVVSSKPMRVAMIGMRGLEDGLGGVEKAAKEISTRLVKQGVEVTCYCRGRYNDRTEFEGIRLINSPTFYSKHLETALYSIWSIRHAMAQGYDVIHLHALASSTLSWIPRLFSPKQKVVTTIHGLDWQRAKWGPIARNVLRLGERCAVRFAHRCICVGLSLQAYFTMRYPKHSFDYIPNGTDAEVLSGLPPPEGFESKKYLLYMGRLVPEKGAHVLIEAYRQLDTDFPLVIAGPCQYAEDYLKKLKELAGDDPRIHFVGTVKGEDKARLLNNAFLFILPSKLEGLPITLLEAAGNGVCIAASSIPTAMEILGGSTLTKAFSFDPHSAEQLKLVIETCVHCPDLVQHVADRAKSHVNMNYNWDVIAQNTLRLYEETAAGLS